MFLEILMIILGFLLLISGANLLVKGSTNIAERFHIPEILIGLTIVALGTSAPELIVTITSASKGAGDLIIGNAVGSNLCNLLLILGLMAILSTIEVDKEARYIHIPVSLFVTILVLMLGISSSIDRKAGSVFLILFIFYFSYPILIEIKDIAKVYRENKNKQINNTRIWKSILFIILGAILLKYGGDFVVDNSINIARILNISEEIIGLTIIAFGTSLPELVTSIFAVIKKDTDLALGNLLGSCILNILLILGVGALITPLAFSAEFIKNLIILLVTNLLIWIFCFIGKKDTLTKAKGIILVIIFLLYIYSLFV